jgi:pilus assembly protein CpaB
MPKRKILLLAVAGLVAIITMAMIHSMMQGAQTEQAQIQTTEVMAAARDLPTGTILRDMDIKWIPWAATADTSQMYLKGKAETSVLVGGVLRQGLHTDEPILQGRVVQAHEHGFLAAVLTPGKRAVSVTLTPSEEVAGFIFPGDHVDVLLTHRFVLKNDKGEPDNTERALSETVVRDARVLALDQKSDDQSTDPKIAQLATVEVTPKQAEALILAIDMAGTAGQGKGSVSLVLRSLAGADGSEPIDSPQVGIENDKATMDSDISPVFPRIARQNKVRVMRGKESTDTIFQSVNPIQK